jgi:predicted HTH transcriptional regulator
MLFQPFNTPIDALRVEHLEQLRDVSEGWHVEYTRAPIPAKNIGKSLSAFANHFGGWLVFGADARIRPKA